jgi:predicted alpha/beta-hydrolase family hydrolase
MNWVVDLGNEKSTSAHHYPAENPKKLLFVLAHGAGAGQRHPFMVNAAKGLAARGVDVVTFDFPYMHAKRGAPDKAPVLEACFERVIEESRLLEGLSRHRLFIGGKSMGGRMATHLGARRSTDAGDAASKVEGRAVPGLAGIVALGYPLHPPGAPDKLRVAHLPDISVPVLIVQGEKDPFGSPAELEPHLKAMKAPVTLHPIAGGDHSLTVRGKRGPEVFESILTAIVDWMIDGALRS